ncbi:hypothetical protein [Hansschlegelia sp.]|uniref:hypothetical protein n=1 Tax=Hansschlegelia sp. TaxID=2041892 RepID=UPI002BD531E4|nr:hypothetical protein [Hansschlegelia sp.]HVI28875.1 hypothetical protein [Hansschlegelia sp.]
MTDCLVALAVASGMSDTDAAMHARVAIDAYLLELGGDAAQSAAAMRELEAGFLELKLDGAPADDIKQNLRARIADLEGGQRQAPG